MSVTSILIRNDNNSARDHAVLGVIRRDPVDMQQSPGYVSVY